MNTPGMTSVSVVRRQSVQRVPTRPAHALSGLAGLPRLDNVPFSVSLRPEAAIWSNLALWCDEAGLMKPEHWKRAYNAEASVLAALGDWANITSGLTLLGCTFSIVRAEGEFVDSYSDEGKWSNILAERGHDITVPHLAISVNHASGVHFHIGETLTAIEAECPGLPGTALSLIRAAANDTLDLIDPTRIMSLAQQTYWYGEVDEKMMLEEMDEEIDPESYVTRAMLDEHAPKWAWFPKDSMTLKALKRIAGDATLSERTRALAAACLSMKQLRKKVTLPSPHQGLHFTECIGVAAGLWWVNQRHCLMSRVWDDYEQQYLQDGDGYLETLGIDTFAATQDGFNGWVKQKTQWFEMARGMEMIIKLVGQEIRYD